jgi:hypothetical protein
MPASANNVLVLPLVGVLSAPLPIIGRRATVTVKADTYGVPWLHGLTATVLGLQAPALGLQGTSLLLAPTAPPAAALGIDDAQGLNGFVTIT